MTRTHTLICICLVAVAALAIAVPASAIVFGPDVIARTGVDSQSACSFLDATRPCPISGELTQWDLFAIQAGSIRLQAFRPVATGYEYLGENVVSVVSGLNSIAIPKPNRIVLQAGDYIGFRYVSLQEGMIGFAATPTFNYSITWPPSESTDVAVGEILPFSSFTGTASVKRVYSLAANVEVLTAPVPEPAGFLALALGMFGAFRLRKR